MKKLWSLLLAAVMVASLVGCGNKQDNSGGEGGAKDVLTIAVMTDCGDMNPHGLTSNKNWKIKGQCYETLFYVDYETGDIEPMLATDYEWVDSCTLKIKLREGVKFHNGGEMTADDVLFSLTEVYNSAANYPIATLDMDKCEKVDDYNIILRTKEPYSPLVNNLSNCATAIFSKAGFEADNGQFSVDIGTGPFVFGEWLEGESVTQERFDDYWAGPAKLSRLSGRSSTPTPPVLWSSRLAAATFPTSSPCWIARLWRARALYLRSSGSMTPTPWSSTASATSSRTTPPSAALWLMPLTR